MSTKHGSDFDEKRREKSGRPIVLEAQDVPFIRLETPEELKQWHEDLMTQHGISWDVSNLPGVACECGCQGSDGRLTSDRSDLETVVIAIEERG